MIVGILPLAEEMMLSIVDRERRASLSAEEVALSSCEEDSIQRRALSILRMDAAVLIAVSLKADAMV